MKRRVFFGIIVGIMASLFNEVLGLKVTDFGWWFMTMGGVIIVCTGIYALIEEKETKP